MTGTPRIEPLPRAQWDDEVREALAGAFPEAAERFFATGSGALPVPNALATMLRHPRLAGAFLAYNALLLREPLLGPRLRELVVLRVAFLTRSRYEWAQHTKLAAGLGMTAAEFDAVCTGAAEAMWSPLESAVLAATDQLVERHCIDDRTWARLAERLDERQLVELVFTAGTYTCLAMAFNSFALELDPDLGDTADGFPGRTQE